MPGRTTTGRALARAMIRKAPFAASWVAVPADLGRTKQRAEAYHAEWTRWLGPSELQFTQRSHVGREAAAQASASRPTTQLAPPSLGLVPEPPGPPQRGHVGVALLG